MLHTGMDHNGRERTAVCCLSSLNAETFLEWQNEPEFMEDVFRFLDNVLQDFIERAPPEMERAVYAAMRERSRWSGPHGLPLLPAEARRLDGIGDGEGLEQQTLQVTSAAAPTLPP